MTIFLCVVVGLVWLSWKSARDRGVPWFSWGGSPKQQVARPRRRAASRRVRAKARPESFPELDGLTRNPETSRRLVNDVNQRHPDKSRMWCAEKAVYDIKRDRMA